MDQKSSADDKKQKILDIATWHSGQSLLEFDGEHDLSHEEYLISYLKLVAEGGGYAGLILGVSFYHLVKAGTFLLEKVYNKEF